MTYFHVSEEYVSERDGPLKPRVLIHCDSSGDEETERISAAPSVGQCLAGMYAWPGAVFRVYAIDEEPDVVITLDIEDDVAETGEVWYTRPVLPRYVGTVRAIADYECGKCCSIHKYVERPGEPIPLSMWGGWRGPDIPFDEGYEWVAEGTTEEQ